MIQVQTKSATDIPRRKRVAKENEIISFTRGAMLIEGLVRTVKENVVIVRISHEDMLSLGIETDLTVVNHKNYQIVRG